MNTIEVYAIGEDQCRKKTLDNSTFACNKNLTRNVFVGCDYACSLILLLPNQNALNFNDFYPLTQAPVAYGSH